jgi:hypothetical protein
MEMTLWVRALRLCRPVLSMYTIGEFPWLHFSSSPFTPISSEGVVVFAASRTGSSKAYTSFSVKMPTPKPLFGPPRLTQPCKRSRDFVNISLGHDARRSVAFAELLSVHRSVLARLRERSTCRTILRGSDTQEPMPPAVPAKSSSRRRQRKDA